MTYNREIELTKFLDDISVKVKEILLSSRMVTRLANGPIKDRILDYSLRGGKCIRPGLVCAAAGALGGNPEDALGIATGIEMTHTWTLVHDDIIDRDEYRRKGLTIHAQIMQDNPDWTACNPAMSVEHLGHSLALLIGDAQHGLVLELMANEGLSGTLPPELVLFLISELEGTVLPALLTGEVSDVFQTGDPLYKITPEEILLMLERKTGALITFSVLAGGLIGLKSTSLEHPWIHALRKYGDNLGLAFQLRDDILGIVGNTNELGKPVGSDFREGKRTLAVKYAYDKLGKAGKTLMADLLGKPDMTADEVAKLRDLVAEGQGVEQVDAYSKSLIEEALKSLEEIPESPYLSILKSVAEYTIARQL